MDGQFISTDIRYRELMNNRRRSTSYRKVKSPGGSSGRSRSVDIGAVGSAVETISEEVGGIEVEGGSVGGANILDNEVFEEPAVVSGGASVVESSVGGGVEEPAVVRGGASVVENSVGGGVEVEPINNVSATFNVASPNGGMKGVVDSTGGVKDEDKVDIDHGAVGGVEVPNKDANNAGSVDGGAVGGVEGPILEDMERGGEVQNPNVLEEGELDGSVGVDGAGGGGIYGMGGFDEQSVGGAEGSVGGVDIGGDVNNTVEPVHHIPRWKLYEILAHAEGECIMSVV